MSQSEFYRQVARSTGENLPRLRRMGFRLVVPSRRRRSKKMRPTQQDVTRTSVPASSRS